MTNTETILGGVVVSCISSIIGLYIGKYDKVATGTCEERRESCRCFIAAEITAIKKKLDELVELVNKKILGI
jgi:hypothetical protein